MEQAVEKYFCLVDDDSDDRLMFSYAVKKSGAGIHYDGISSGEELFGFIDQGKLPDIIFLDLNMPGMDGWQCLEKLKNNETTKGIPVLIYSTSSFEKDIEKAASMNALSYIAKPEDLNELIKLVALIYAHIQKDLKAALSESKLSCVKMVEGNPFRAK